MSLIDENNGGNMADLLVIADDFTGALDTGVQFSQSISTRY